MFELKCKTKCYKAGRIYFVGDVMNVGDEKTAKAMEKAGNWEIISAPAEKAPKKAALAKGDKVPDPLAS